MDKEPDVAALGRDFLAKLTEVGSQFKQAFEEQAEEAQYRLDRAFAEQMAKHPEVYADLRRGYRKLKKNLDAWADNLGLR